MIAVSLAACVLRGICAGTLKFNGQSASHSEGI